MASQEDFEVVMFLTEGLTRHSLITKQKQFAKKPKIQSTGNKLTGWLNDSENPITLEDNDDAPEGLREGVEDEPALGDIPELTENGRRKKDDDPLFVSSVDEGTFQTQRVAPSKRRKATKRQGSRVDRDDEEAEAEADVEDDKKKLALNTTYDGFSIYGRILCLIVKRKGKKATQSALGASVGGSEMMEHWVSTQVAQEAELQDDDEG